MVSFTHLIISSSVGKIGDLPSTSVTVRYINKFTGEEISEKKVYNGVEKQEFDITNDVKDIDGFTLTEEPIMKNGEMPRDPIVLDYVYTKKVKVTAKYIDKVHPTEFSKIFEDKIKLFNSNFNSFINFIKNLKEFPNYEIKERNFESNIQLPVLSKKQIIVSVLKLS